MKKLTFILASMMLCFAVSMSSCSDKKGSSASDASSASDTTAASDSIAAGAVNPGEPSSAEAEILAIISDGVNAIAYATTEEELDGVRTEITTKVAEWGKANPDLMQAPTEAMLAAQTAFENAYLQQLEAIKNGTAKKPSYEDNNNGEGGMTDGAEMVEATVDQF